MAWLSDVLQIIIIHKLYYTTETRIHSAHLGVNGCLRRARASRFWPRMSSELKEYILSCDTCRTYSTGHQNEPLSPHQEVSRPWEKVGSELFTLAGRNYLITLDYYSNFREIDYLPTTTATA